MVVSTVYLSRHPGHSSENGWPDELVNLLGLDDGQCRRFEDEVAALVSKGGARVVVVPHLYYLTVEHPASGQMAATAGDIVVASWLYPRQSYWTMRANGIEGCPRCEGADSSREAFRGERAIRCESFVDYDSPFACAEKLLELAGAADGDSTPLAGVVEQVEAEAAPRWYPVIDYGRCIGCGQCYEFCLFGVYDCDDGRVAANRPDQCKPGCPACARVCPAGAIMFPHHGKGPAIAGAPGTCVQPDSVDAQAFFRQCAADAGLDAACACACEAGEARMENACAADGSDGGADRECCAGEGGDDLDALIDALDELD